MGLPKCRLDVWNPTVTDRSGTPTTVTKWVTAQNPENQNAVVSVFILDKLANSRVADVTLTNRAKNFTSTGGFDYHYQDSEGNNVLSGDGIELSANRGVLTNLFHDFMQVRLVDEATNQVLYTGRIIDVDESYDARSGQILRIKMRDALEELAQISPKGLNVETVIFYPSGASGNGINSSHPGHSITDIVKAYIACGYKKEYLPFGKTSKTITGYDRTAFAALTVTTDELIAETTYDPTNYIANIVTDDTGSVEYLSRFQEDTKAVSTTRHVNFKKSANRGLLGEILRTLQTAPQESQQNNQDFGWDYYIDPNISYQEHADFKGKNLLPTAPPPPAMFNTFRRGKRIYNINPATYGLAVKYPAASDVESQGHYTDESTSPDTVQYATKPMSHEFAFTRPKDKLYSSLHLKYTDESGKTSKTNGVDKEVLLHIMYVTNVTGQFDWGDFSGTGDTAYVEPAGLSGDDDLYLPASYVSAEYLNLYNMNDTLAAEAVARIQYQSIDGHPTNPNSGYILVSHLDKTLLTRTSGSYYLKGAGDKDGNNPSAVTCDLNLNTTIANLGFPRRVWGVDRQHTLSRGSVTDLHSLRQEAAALLSRSSTEIVDGAFAFSGPPMYHYDAEIRVVTSVSGGQRIQIRNAGGTENVILSWYGFRNGMLIAKMDSTYSSIATTNVTVNGASVAKDIYGYCWNREIGEVWSVTLSEGQSFSVGDKVRFFVPVRAGDTIRVENVLSNVSGNHLVKEIEYTEEPNQMTRIKTTGVNEGIGLDGVRYAALLAGSREESDLRMNIPAGHQPALWTGLFSAVDNNTIQWQTVGGLADVVLADGKTFQIDTATANGNNTTHATSEDAEETAFGIANAAHPVAGDATVYYIYVDPNTENVIGGEKSHFYTRPATSPVSGSDAVYTQDGDNIIVGWMKAGASTDDLAEFGVYRDSKPGDGKRNLAIVSHPGTATSALLKKGAQTFTTDLMIESSKWPHDDAYREVKWHGGEKSDGSQDTDTANIKLADGTTRTINYGGDSGDSGGGQYVYHNGTNYSQSPLSQFGPNNTYYAFIDFAVDASGTMTLRWTNVSTIPYGDDRILLAIIVVPPDETKGRSPLIIPLTTKSLAINAVAIAANSITADHVAAGTIDADHLRIGSSSGAIAGLTSAGTLNLSFIGSGNMDNIGDGSTYGKLRINNLSGGNLDFNSNSIANKNLDNLPNGSTYGRIRDRDLNDGDIDFNNSNYLNKNLNYISDGSTYKRTTANQRDGGGRGYAGLNTNNRVSQNIVAAATSHGENVTAYFYGGSSDSPSNLLLINAAGMASYAGVSGSYPSFTLPTYATFQILTSNGQAQFGSNTVIADSTGLKVYSAATSGTLRTWLKSNSGMAVSSSYSGGLWFQNLAAGSSGTVYSFITTGSGTNSTYGHSSNNTGFYMSAVYEDIILNASNADVYLHPKTGGTYEKEGYVKIGDRPIVFMDKDNATPSNSLHLSSMDFVGFWKLAGDIARSTVYRLPWASSNTSPSDGQVLAINGVAKEMDGTYAGSSSSTYGLPSNPYVFDLEWVDAGGSADPLRLGDGSASSPTFSFTSDTNTGMYSAGSNSNAINFSCNSNPRVQFNTSGINMLGSDGSSYIYGVHVIRTNNGSASAPSYTFNPNNDDTGMYYSSGLSFSVGGSRKLGLDSATASVYGYLNISTVTTGGVYDLKWGTDGFVYRSTSSTRKAKMNIEDLTIDTSKIYDLDLKSFNFRGVTFEDGVAIYDDVPGEKSFGLIAEEVYEILPELAVLDNGEPATVDYKMLSVLLLAELKELRTRIEVLEGN